MEDDYFSKNDSQFGDKAVTKRLFGVLRSNRIFQHLKFENNGNVEKKGTKWKQISLVKGKKQSKGGKNALTPQPIVNIVDYPFLKRTGCLYNFEGEREHALKE